VAFLARCPKDVLRLLTESLLNGGSGSHKHYTIGWDERLLAKNWINMGAAILVGDRKNQVAAAKLVVLCFAHNHACPPFENRSAHARLNR